MGQRNREGYSLIELLLAIAISSLVMAGLVIIMGYVTRSMSVTEAKVNLQNDAKDAMNHLSSYAAEASSYSWDSANHVLTLSKTVVESAPSPLPSAEAATVTTVTTDAFYWMSDGKLYFASEETDAGVASGSLPTDKRHVLAENVDSFVCSPKVDETDEDRVLRRKVLHIQMKMKKANAEFTSSDDVYLRNQ